MIQAKTTYPIKKYAIENLYINLLETINFIF